MTGQQDVASSALGPDLPSNWLFMLRHRDSALEDRLRAVYGQDAERIEQRREVLIRLLDEFLRRHSDSRPVWIVRAPGRMTTLAMHIDHRGGYLNALCLQQEMLLVCRARQDDVVILHNLREGFLPCEFAVSEIAPEGKLSGTQEWLKWTSRLAALRDERGERHNWIHKAAASAAYMQFMYQPDRPLRGMEAVMVGDVPIGGGLSSSSSVVVACMEALLAVNDIEIPHDEFAHHCGVAEWFVGTRGGCGDHAAIKYGRAGQLTHMRTEPEFVLGAYLDFPATHRFVVFSSGIVADKTGTAGQMFNEKTATYAIGEMYMRRWLKSNRSDFYNSLWEQRNRNPIDKQVFLADVVEAVDSDGLYDLLDDVPGERTRDQLRSEWSGDGELLAGYFQTHHEPEAYHLRDVIAYGLAACSRARQVKDVLASGDVDTFAEWMNVSHDADRVSNVGGEIADRKRADDRSIPLHLQSGDYHCSIPEIDRMVDIARSAGAVGAQIAGAGMGGSMIALVPMGAQQQVIDALSAGYRTPTGQPPSYFIAEPCSGSGIL